jgi:hypothetical protein
VLILIWLACSDPQFGPVSDAVKAYDKGQSELAAGTPLRAAGSFSEAAEADPDHAILRGWQAWALEQAGETDDAIEVLDTALSAHPGDSELRYNRAAFRARTGMLKAAAADLGWLYANDIVQPVEVGEDSDFLALATHPEFRSLVPTAQIQADLRGEAGSVLLGERFTLHLSVTVRKGARIEIEDLGEATGLLRHTQTIENISPDGPLWTRRAVTIVFKTVAPGQATMGPWLLKSGGSSALTGRVAVEVIALAGAKRSGPVGEATAAVLPSSMGAAEPPWIGIYGGLRVARVGPKHSITPSVKGPGGPVYELWSQGQVQWRQVPLPPGPHRLTQAGRVVASDP